MNECKGCTAPTEGAWCVTCRLNQNRLRAAAPIALQPTGMCWLCGVMGADTIDHVVPLTRGGDNEPSNLRPAHRACNSRKGDRIVTGFQPYGPKCACLNPLLSPRSIESGECASCHPDGPNV